ncbi:hypothetical protein [Nonomuraea sp. NPDC050540]|uniref:hypothetical protein n=1 Tax=Nonomuraea sp. NPDC050540 TaxID=3364367 RepID=UPI0037B59628
MKTLIAALAAATISAGAPTPPPAERAYVCDWGIYYFNPLASTMNIMAGGCTGPSGTGPATITLLSGVMNPPATFSCRMASILDGRVLGSSC